MSRNYGIMSGPQHLGGASMSRSATPGSYAPRDPNVIRFPSASILAEPTGPAFERNRFLQALLDVFAVVAGALFVTVTAVSVVVAFAILLFVKL